MKQKEIKTGGTIDLNKIVQANPDEKVVEVYRLLKRYAEDPDRKDWIKDVYQRGWEVAFNKTNSLWTDDEKKAMQKKKQIPIAINDIAKGIQGSCAVATANKPGINVKPIGFSDLYVAELLKRAFDFVWGQNHGQSIIYDAVQEAKTGSLGVFDVFYDNTKGKHGKIVINSDDPQDYYFDKKSRRLDKSDSHLIKAHLITKEYAKENHDVTDEDLEFNPMAEDEDAGKSSAGKPGEDEYARIKTEKDTMSRDAGTEIGEDEPALVWEIEAWLKKKKKTYSIMFVDAASAQLEELPAGSQEAANQFRDALIASGIKAEVKVKHTEYREQRVIVGKKLISVLENPYGLDSDGDPVVPKILLGHDRSWDGYFVSPTYRAIEISRSRNKRRIQSIYTITKNIEAPVMKTEGTKWEIDEEHGDALVVPKDAPFPPQRLLPGTTSSEIMVMEQRDEAALNEEFDMHDVMKGKLPPGVDSGKLVLALQDQAGMMSTPFVGKLETALEKMAKVIFCIALKYWPREMWVRLIDDEEMGEWQPEKDKQLDPMTGDPVKPEPTEITAKWMKALERIRPADPAQPPGLDLEGLDIKLVAGSTTPTNRMARRMDAMEMVKAGVYDAEAALDYADDPYKDQVKTRMKQKEQMMMQAGMMKGQK